MASRAASRREVGADDDDDDDDDDDAAPWQARVKYFPSHPATHQNRYSESMMWCVVI